MSTEVNEIATHRRMTHEEQRAIRVPNVLLLPGRHGLIHRAELSLHWLPGIRGRPDCYGIEADVRLGRKRTETFRLAIPAAKMRRLKREGEGRVEEVLRSLLDRYIREATA